MNTKVPREFSRRCRKLDLSVLKAQELRNIVLFYFPYVIASLSENKEKKLWLLLSFSIRAAILPLKEINFDIEIISQYMSEFYTLYEEMYGPRNCTYTCLLYTSPSPRD